MWGASASPFQPVMLRYIYVPNAWGKGGTHLVLKRFQYLPIKSKVLRLPENLLKSWSKTSEQTPLTTYGRTGDGNTPGLRMRESGNQGMPPAFTPWRDRTAHPRPGVGQAGQGIRELCQSAPKGSPWERILRRSTGLLWRVLWIFGRETVIRTFRILWMGELSFAPLCG